ncbi:MAG: Rrf2 family transcriptional regulator [Candidatus Omnitrophica bacterium]|nr:Rrf2 family transcriptional regulator [Candidatus Omnitrophota bacterium]
MKPSSGVRYALTALVDLTLHQQTGPVTVAAIAKRRGIPVRYLEQLFNRLRRRGIVAAERGPRGGYRLNRTPGEIPVSEIFHCLESVDAVHPEQADPSLAVWKQVEAAVQTTLEATTLEALVAQARERVPSPINHPFTFHI